MPIPPHIKPQNDFKSIQMCNIISYSQIIRMLLNVAIKWTKKRKPQSFPPLLVSDLSYRLASPLSTPTILLPATGAVETAQPIRTVAIIAEPEEQPKVVESEEAQEELKEAREDCSQALEALEVAEESEGQKKTSADTRSRSSSITSWESTQGTSEMSSSRYSTITQEDFQQELVVKPVKLKRKGKRIRHGECSLYLHQL